MCRGSVWNFLSFFTVLKSFTRNKKILFVGKPTLLYSLKMLVFPVDVYINVFMIKAYV